MTLCGVHDNMHVHTTVAHTCDYPLYLHRHIYIYIYIYIYILTNAPFGEHALNCIVWGTWLNSKDRDILLNRINKIHLQEELIKGYTKFFCVCIILLKIYFFVPQRMSPEKHRHFTIYDCIVLGTVSQRMIIFIICL